MAKPVFKEYNQGLGTLFPATLDSKIPQDSPVRLVSQIVDNLDISRVVETYQGGGTSSYHPRMMLKVVIYAYLNNIYSCRKIENCLKDRITFMWLSGNQEPDHNTLNRFRSKHLKKAISEIFTQVVMMLVEMGYLSLEVIYIDGTKLESRANKYTFVWRKRVENNKAKLEARIRNILQQIEEGIAQDNHPDDEPPTPINSEELKKRIAEINRENRTKGEQKSIKTLENKYLPKLQEYEKHLETLGNRNNYSKTDPDATFMRMKDDHMQNGQLKPAYNVQIGTENQFLTHYDFYSNPTDTLTFIPFINGFEQRYQKMPQKGVADAGYGSEENYEFMEINAIEPFVKYNYFHKEQKKSFKNNAFIAQNLFYNAQKDYFVCPMGQHMEKVGVSTRKSGSGYVSNTSIYKAQNCTNCPLRCLCHSAKEDRRIEVNHHLNRYKEKVRELLTSEEGLLHRKRRPIEPEAVFGQTKFDYQYNRFRHFDKDKVMMDFGIFAVAFNIKKLYRKGGDMSKNEHIGAQKAKKADFIVFFTAKIIILTPKQNLSPFYPNIAA
jgi:transposase